MEKTNKIVFKKYDVKNFEILITLSFGFFLSRHLQSPITQKVLERYENFFLLFEADEMGSFFGKRIKKNSPVLLSGCPYEYIGPETNRDIH